MDDIRTLGLAGIALAGLAVSGAAHADAGVAGTRLSIVAEGTTVATPDLLRVRAGVVTQAPTAAAALKANADAMSRTIAALRQRGVEERDLTTSDLQLQPQMRYTDGQPPVITGYQAVNQLGIRFRKVEAAGAILDALVAAGANQIEGPSFELSQPDLALDRARADAVAKARARADLYARAAGLRVGRIVSMEEQASGGPVRPMPMMMVARKADATPILAGEQAQTVTLAVTFELD